MRSIDEERFALRFTPRKRDSIWSEINRRRAMEMIKKGRMTKEGMEKVDEAKRSGKWDSAYSSKERPVLPDDLKSALSQDEKALRNFSGLSNSRQTAYVYWIASAKREEMRGGRIREVVRRARIGDK